MTYFLIYSDAANDFISNAIFADRKDANKMCDFLESIREGIFIPVKFVDGQQVTII